MNMPQRPDEQLLWRSFGKDQEHRIPREAGAALGIPSKRVQYLCGKWSGQGIYDYGVSIDTGWKL